MDNTIIWLKDNGMIISCTEKIKVMQQNLEEFRMMAQDLLEDALLMEIQETQVKEELHKIIATLHNPYKK